MAAVAANCTFLSMRTFQLVPYEVSSAPVALSVSYDVMLREKINTLHLRTDGVLSTIGSRGSSNIKVFVRRYAGSGT